MAVSERGVNPCGRCGEVTERLRRGHGEIPGLRAQRGTLRNQMATHRFRRRRYARCSALSRASSRSRSRGWVRRARAASGGEPADVVDLAVGGEVAVRRLGGPVADPFAAAVHVVEGGGETSAGHAAEPGLLLDLAQRAREGFLTTLEFALGVRPSDGGPTVAGQPGGRPPVLPAVESSPERPVRACRHSVIRLVTPSSPRTGRWPESSTDTTGRVNDTHLAPRSASCMYVLYWAIASF